MEQALRLAKQKGQAYNLNLAVSDILAPDGRCNWHHCRECFSSPNPHRAFWGRKRETNMARDRRATRQLRGRGWKVIRIWQLPSAVYAVLRLSTPFPE